MIPTDLKPGAILRCVEPRGSALSADKLYVLVRYKRFDNNRVVVCEQGSNDVSCVGAGWYLRRFELACNADGADYQAADDVDLAVDHYANMTTRIERA